MGRIWGMAVAMVFLTLSGASGESLWRDGASLFGDARPTAVGDIVTVVVSERTSVKDEAKTDLTKTNNSNLDDGVGLLGKLLSALGFRTDSSMTGEGSTERKHTVSTRITCLVTEVLPNGNLVLEGGRDLQVHGETLHLLFRGVIRPRDVAHDNTVESDMVANAEIGVKGKGSLTRVQRPGLLTQLFQAIF